MGWDGMGWDGMGWTVRACGNFMGSPFQCLPIDLDNSQKGNDVKQPISPQTSADVTARDADVFAPMAADKFF